MSNLSDLETKLNAKIDAHVYQTADDEFIEDGVDLRVRAPNAVEWIAGSKFLNVESIWQFTRQYELVRDFFQLRCPICNKGDGDCWGKSPTQLQDEVRLVWSPAYSEDVCPKCNTTRTEFNHDQLLRSFDTFIGVAGMRSGKSVMAGMLGTYIRHVYTTFGIKDKGSIHKMFGLLPTQNLELAFVATTATQAKETIWANFQKQCTASPWFKRYAAWITRKMNRQLVSPGQRPWIYNELTDFIQDDWLMFNCASLNSNSGGLAGRTRVGFLADELSRFGVTDSKMGADEIWAVFDHSLKTIRGARIQFQMKEPWLGTAITVSSPISIEDKTMRLYNEAKELKNYFAWKYPTWEFNPFQPRSNFESDYKADPVMAERDFGASPPNATNPLIQDPLRFWLSVAKSSTPTAIFRATHPIDKSGREYVGAELEHSIVERQRPLYIFGDAGKSFDQFALVACSGVWAPAFNEPADQFAVPLQPVQLDPLYIEPQNNSDPEQMTLMTVHEWSLRIIPEDGNPGKREVWYESVVDILRKLMKYRKIAMVAFDSWNSASTLQTISNMGIPTTQVSLNVSDFSKAVQDAMLGRAKLLPPRPSDKLSLDPSNGSLILGIKPQDLSAEGATLYELLKLERSKDLKQVFNPLKGKVRGANSDDLANCFAGAHRLVQESIGKITNTAMEIRRSKEEAGASKFVGGLARGPRWG
jgi:hypothetical protein